MTDRVGRTVAVLTGSRIAVFVVALAAIGAMSLAVALAAPGTPLWPALLLLSLALLALADSDSPLGLLLLVGYGAWWLLAVPAGPQSALWAVGGAVAALTFHLALAHEAAGPGGVPSPHTQLGSLLSGGFLVAGLTAIAGLLAALAEGQWSAPAWIAGGTVVLLAVVPWLAQSGHEPPTEEDA